jgi:hypothetical protein
MQMHFLRFLIGLLALTGAALVIASILALVKTFGLYAALVLPLIILSYLLGCIFIPLK